jgi:MYXO-CTERM domain-containing protein
MKTGMKRLICGALLLCAAPGALAQDGNAIGNPQLRDFRLTPSGPQPAQPQPAPPPVVVAPPPATSNQAQPAPTRQAERPTTAAPTRAPARTEPQTQPPAQTQAPPAQPAPQPQAPVLPQAAPPAPAATNSTPEATGEGFPWRYAIPAGAALLIALAFLLRRRRRSALIAEAAEAAAPPAPRPAAPVPAAPPPVPVARPWLELRLKAEKAAATLDETVVHFELEIENSGESAARNLRIDVKMFNAGQEQDQEIGAFFRTAGRESTKLNLPGIAAGQTGAIRGEVAMPRDEMRAVVLENKYLFIPMIAVNALYDWGDGEMGQTSKSYVVGRELEQNDKMGAFRVDLGPRIWKTVGQRDHTLARRV